jgi:hypothetical protein
MLIMGQKAGAFFISGFSSALINGSQALVGHLAQNGSFILVIYTTPLSIACPMATVI